MRTAVRRLTWLLCVLLVLTGCSSRSAPATASRVKPVGCPSDIEVQLLVKHDCLELTVPLDRQRTNGPVAKVLVLRLVPPGQPSSDPMLAFGSDAGDSPGYGGLAAMAGRVHRIVYLLDPRGTGHSLPSLACPEADAVTATTADSPTRFAAASQTCLQRLKAHGADPALFGPGSVAADAADLRHALRITRWNVISFGTSSVDAVSAAADDSASVRSLILDSPAPIRPVSSVIGNALAAWQRVAADCSAQPTCAKRYPHVEELWALVARQLADHPVAGPAGTAARIDAVGLARLVRSLLGGEGPQFPASLPATLTSMLHGQLGAEAAHRLSTDRAACLGYRPLCTHQFNLAAYLTTLCPSVLSEGRIGASRIPGHEAFGSADPYLAACARWPLPVAPRALPASVPVLVLDGALDPFFDRAAIGQFRVSTHSYEVEVPGQTHNALGFADCPIAIRNAFVDAPDRAPDTACLATVPRLPFTTP